MASLGLSELDRYELIEGELVCKMSKNPPHMRAVMLLCDWLRTAFGRTQVVQEPTIDVAPADSPASAPEPDAVVLSRSLLDLVEHPKPEQIRLLVEVSDTTLAYDLTTKAALYARAGIADYWVLDVNGRRVVVHRLPADGAYQSVLAFAENEKVSPLGAPAAEIRVGDLF